MVEKGRITKGGMGGFLNPPGHPEHDWHVETGLWREPENRGEYSLRYAVDSPMLDLATRAAARTLLNTWELTKAALNSPAVVKWIHQVLGYYAGCFNFQAEGNSEQGWYTQNLTIDSDVDPLENAEFHAGVHRIREFYPDYTPCRLDFLRAYWGTKPESKPGRRKKKATA